MLRIRAQSQCRASASVRRDGWLMPTCVYQVPRASSYLLRTVLHLMQSSRVPIQAGASSDQPATVSHEAAVNAWAPPPDPVAGSTNDRRVASYRTHPPRRMGVTSNAIPFGSMPAGVNSQLPAASNSITRRQQSRPFQLANQSSRRNTSSDTSIVFKAIFIPYPVSIISCFHAN